MHLKSHYSRNRRGLSVVPAVLNFCMGGKKMARVLASAIAMVAILITGVSCSRTTTPMNKTEASSQEEQFLAEIIEEFITITYPSEKADKAVSMGKAIIPLLKNKCLLCPTGDKAVFLWIIWTIDKAQYEALPTILKNKILSDNLDSDLTNNFWGGEPNEPSFLGSWPAQRLLELHTRQ